MFKSTLTLCLSLLFACTSAQVSTLNYTDYFHFNSTTDAAIAGTRFIDGLAMGIVKVDIAGELFTCFAGNATFVHDIEHGIRDF